MYICDSHYACTDNSSMNRSSGGLEGAGNPNRECISDNMAWVGSICYSKGEKTSGYTSGTIFGLQTTKFGVQLISREFRCPLDTFTACQWAANVQVGEHLNDTTTKMEPIVWVFLMELTMLLACVCARTQSTPLPRKRPLHLTPARKLDHISLNSVTKEWITNRHLPHG